MNKEHKIKIGGYEKGEKKEIYQGLSAERLRDLIIWKKSRIKKLKKGGFSEEVEGLEGDLKKIKETLKDKEVKE